MFKKKMSVFIVGMVLAQELTYTQAMAQATSTDVVAIGGGARATTGFLSAGDYNINQSVTDYSKTASEILQQKGITNKEDREYLQSIGRRLAQQFSALIEKEKAFRALGQKASLDASLEKMVKLTQYLDQVNDINAALETIRIEIQAASIISKDSLPSNGFKVGNVAIDMGPTSIINMEKAMAPFLADLERMIERLNSVQFRFLSHKNAYGEVMSNALSPDLSKFPQMTSDEVQAAIEKVEQLSVISRSTQTKQQVLADLTVQKVKKYMQLVGTEEFLRFRNENDKIFASEAYKDVEKAFFMRSYLRRKYGLQIGAIQPMDYRKLPANTEAIFSKQLIAPITFALNSLRSQTARGDADILQAYNNARQFVEQYDKKLTPILSKDAAAKRASLKRTALPAKASLWDKAKAEAEYRYNQAAASFASREEIMGAKPVVLNEDQKSVAYNSDDTGFTARMSGVLTTLTGQVSTTETLLAVMRLVLADIREELMLSQGDLGNMQSYHFQRFMSGEAQIVRSVKSMCDYDNTLSNDARARARTVTNNKVTCTPPASVGILANVNSGGADHFKTVLRNIMLSYQNYEVARAIEARNLRNLVEAAMAAGVQEGDKPSDEGLFDIPQ